VIIHLDLLAVRIGPRAQNFSKIFSKEFFARIFDGRIKNNAAMSILSESSGQPAAFKQIGAGALLLFHARGT
jgi:hypothetical protein